MERTVSLRQNTLFKRAYYKGVKKHGALFTIFCLPNRLSTNRLGITVTKKVGKAVQRNRARRLLYEAYRLHEPTAVGRDYVLVAKPELLAAPFPDIRRQMDKLLRASVAKPPVGKGK